MMGHRHVARLKTEAMLHMRKTSPHDWAQTYWPFRPIPRHTPHNEKDPRTWARNPLPRRSRRRSFQTKRIAREIPSSRTRDNENGRSGINSDRPPFSGMFQMSDSVENIIADAQRGVNPDEIRARAAAVTCSDIDRQRLDALIESMKPRGSGGGLLTIGGGD